MGNFPSTATCVGGGPMNSDGNNLFYGPSGTNTEFAWTAVCGQEVTAGPIYQTTQETSWYACAARCDASNMCYISQWDSSSGVCNQYATSDSLNYGTTVDSASMDLFVGSTNAQGTTCVPGEYDGYVIQCGVDYTGGDTGSRLDGLSFKGCINACSQATNCVGVSYDTGDDGGYQSSSCDLKSSIGQQISNPALWAAQLLNVQTPEDQGCVPGESSGYIIECGTDYSGGDMGSQNGLTFPECIALCTATSGCIDVAFNAGSCYMKNNIGPQVSNPAVWTARQVGATTGLSCVNNFSNGMTYDGFVVSCGIDYTGGDLTSASTPTLEECIDTCSTTPNCIDVSYTGNTCYMKSTIGQPSSNGAVITALKAGYQQSSTPPPATGLSCDNDASDGTTYTTSKGVYLIHCNADYFGGDLTSQNADTFADCVTACDNTPGCIDVSYTGNSCYMKNQLLTLKSTNGVNTAVLQSALSNPADTQPPAPTTLSCVNDASNGQQYVAHSGAVFEVTCGIDYRGGDLSSAQTTTFQDCLDLCDSTSGCVDVAYSGVACYMKNQLNPGIQDSGVWGAKLVTSAAASSSTPPSRTTAAASTAATSTTTESSSPSAVVVNKRRLRFAKRNW